MDDRPVEKSTDKVARHREITRKYLLRLQLFPRANRTKNNPDKNNPTIRHFPLRIR